MKISFLGTVMISLGLSRCLLTTSFMFYEIIPRGYPLQFLNRPFYSCVLSYLAMNASEAGVDLALIQTSLLFSCKCKLVSITTT